MTEENPDLYSYPDGYLRILKYCRDLCDEETYKTLAKDAVEGFKARIEDGDNYSNKLLKEAIEIYNSLGIED